MRGEVTDPHTHTYTHIHLCKGTCCDHRMFLCMYTYSFTGNDSTTAIIHTNISTHSVVKTHTEMIERQINNRADRPMCHRSWSIALSHPLFLSQAQIQTHINTHTHLAVCYILLHIRNTSTQIDRCSELNFTHMCPLTLTHTFNCYAAVKCADVHDRLPPCNERHITYITRWLTVWSSPPGSSGSSTAPPTAAHRWCRRWRRRRSRGGGRYPAWEECPATGSQGYACLKRQTQTHTHTHLYYNT